jgi:hypothetical protein
MEAQDPAIITHFFQIFSATKAKYNVEDSDVWSMDKKGAALGVVGKT